MSNSAKPPHLSLGFLLPRVAHSLARDFETLLTTKFGVRSQHLGVLSTLKAYGPHSQRQIAKYLGLERQTLVNITDELEKMGLVQRQTDAQDRRSQLLHLTEAGKVFQEAVDKVAEEHEQQVFGVLSDEEQAALHLILNKLAQNGHFQTLFVPFEVD